MKIGIDIVEVARIAKALNRGNQGFYNIVYTSKEVAYIKQVDSLAMRAAGLWAAKEAVVKALGCGFSGGICFHDIEVNHTQSGQPYVLVSGKLEVLLKEQGLQVLSISISHTEQYAAATALIGFVA